MEKDYRERHLEEWLFNNPSGFEDGIRWLTRQRPVYWRGQKIGKTDLQGIDKDNKIVIIELKAKELNHHDISQALCYWRSVSTHEYGDTRLVFIGTSMSTRFRIVLEWIQEISDINIEIYFYKLNLDGYVLEKYDKVISESFCVPILK